MSFEEWFDRSTRELNAKLGGTDPAKLFVEETEIPAQAKLEDLKKREASKAVPGPFQIGQYLIFTKNEANAAKVGALARVICCINDCGDNYVSVQWSRDDYAKRQHHGGYGYDQFEPFNDKLFKSLRGIK